MWKNAQRGSNIDSEPHQQALLAILEEEETANMPDINLENDLLVLEEDLIGATGPPPHVTEENETHPDLRVDVEHTIDGPHESHYIEEFPADLGAGAVWGEDMPSFEKIWHMQQESGSSVWGPFDDEDEWELAKWLIRNVGQNQINGFLNLNVVSSYHLTP
jgi:hypothetical protein